MSTFYLMPPRPVFVSLLTEFLQTWMPGLPVPVEAGAAIAEALHRGLAERNNAFLIFREDLPEGADPSAALRDGFGAQDGDRVIEMRLSGRSGEAVARTWTVGNVSAA